MRVALGIEYLGAAFSGYQIQPHAPSVQGALQQALTQVANEPITIDAAGRTDAGVHATGQVVSFLTSATRSADSWRRGANSLAGQGVTVHWASEVDSDFHPRYTATARRYMYLFYEAADRSPLLDGLAVRSAPLNDAAMYTAAQWLLGEHDFSSFRGAACQSRSAFRRLDRISVHRTGSIVTLDIQANAFLLHMVRNIAGVLWQVGLERSDPSWVPYLLKARDRRQAGATAPPQGLYLVAVHYPGQNFPTPPLPAPLRALGGLDRFS
jgi:tRNA pseudouridine38-40 synthase